MSSREILCNKLITYLICVILLRPYSGVRNHFFFLLFCFVVLLLFSLTTVAEFSTPPFHIFSYVTLFFWGKENSP